MKKMTEQFDDRLKSVLLDLTWKKMKVWADPDSVERGRGYLDNVEEPRQYPDGSVIAEVHGSEDWTNGEPRRPDSKNPTVVART